MSFLSRCIFCNHEFRAADHESGKRLRCVKCDSLTIMQPVPEEPALAAVVPATMIEPPASPARETLPPAEPEISPDDENLLDFSRLARPLGAVAFLLGSAGLMCASIEALCASVIPLASGGLVAGIAAVVLARYFAQPRPIIPMAGSVVGGAVLFAAFLSPALLGPTFLASRQPAPVDVLTLRAAPLAGKYGSVRILKATEWVDASRSSLQQGRLSVQVTGASVGPLNEGVKEKDQRQEFLIISLRIHLAEDGRTFASNQRQNLSSGFDPPRPRLTEAAGNAYELRDVRHGFQMNGGRGVFPSSVLSERFVFARPPRDVEFLRLELDAACWGGRGTWRFQIPTTMIRWEPAVAPQADSKADKGKQ